jgi:hypothetical protein
VELRVRKKEFSDRMPMEEALTAFAGIDIPKKEMEKGIPFVSFVVKEGEGAVFIGPLPLFAADSLWKEQEIAGREILYRADYLRGGREKFAAGVLSAGEKTEPFLKLLGRNISSGSAKADIAGIYPYLEAHLTLCGLESLAMEEIAFMGREEAGTEDYRAANSSYYKEVLSFVETGRRYLNTGVSGGISLPPFPDRSKFMAKWYREHKGSQ